MINIPSIATAQGILMIDIPSVMTNEAAITPKSGIVIINR